MATMSDIVSGALKRLRVINPRKNPDGVTADEGLTALNDMMHSWKGLGIDSDHETLTLTDEFPLDDEHIQGVKALLAVRLAGDYGLDVNAGIVRDADMGWTAIQAEFGKAAPDPEFDAGLVNLTLGRCM